MKVKTILITGTDLVGKTTLINQLIIYLNKSGFHAISNKNELFKTDIMNKIQLLLNDTSTNKDFELINNLFLLTFLIDSLKFQPDPNKILIQDSYACRTMAFYHAYQLHLTNDPFNTLKCHFFSFDLNIHLKASIECRVERLYNRSKNNLQDLLIITDPEKIKLMDIYLDNMVKTFNNYFQLDTSNLTISQVFDQVINFINKFIR